MYRDYFPSCPVDGPIEPPVPCVIFTSSGAIPNKCGACNHFFEGGCTRVSEELHRYMHLDYGPCTESGSTHPVLFEDKLYGHQAELPQKCTKCRFLMIHQQGGFYCSQDAEKWGDFTRGFDWGDWQPEEPYIELPDPKVTTKSMMQAVAQNARTAFVREHREVNLGHPFSVAIADFEYLREKLKASQDNDA